MKRLIRRVVMGVFQCLLLAGIASAQTGSIQGTVSDQTGAVVQAAEVVARNIATNATRIATTGSSGTYSMPSMPVGHYEITAKKSGFKTFHLEDIELTIAQELRVDGTLEPGSVSEEVLVKASDLPPVDLETAQVSNLVSSQEIKDLPLVVRDPYSLVLLSPGTSQTNSALGGFTVNGSRERNNNFLLDGVDNNDTSVPGGSQGLLQANPDSTEEFRVITNNYNAEFGRNTGAIIDVVTKSGTNQFHGGAYEFGRWNTFGGARDWFNPAGGINARPMNPYIRNQFGYSFGGPIWKNKTFFFVNQEFQRFRTTLTNFSIVPTAGFKSGVFNYTAPDSNGSLITTPVDLNGASNAFALPADPTAQEILALYPNAAASADGLSGTIFYPSSSRQNSWQGVVKIDHHFTDRNSLSLRYGYDNFSDPDSFHDDFLPGNIGATAEKAINQGFTANLTSTLTNNLINNFVVGWNRIYAAFNCSNRSEIDGVSPLDQFGNARDYTLDPFTSFGCLSLVSNGQFRKTGTLSFADTVSWVRGQHTLRFGADFRDIGERGPNSFFSRRQVLTNTFVNTGTSLINAPANDTVALEDAASAYYGFVWEDLNAEFFNKKAVRQGTDDKHFQQHEYDFFGQDTWKFRPNLTFTIGLRYQLDGVPYEDGANFSNLLAPPDSFPVVFTTVGPGTGHQIYQPDYSNIEPRVGFCWDPWKNGKTAVRGAFGIFHDRVFGNLFGNARGNPPFEQDYQTFPFETINNAFGSGAFPVIPPDTTPSPVVPDGAGIAPVIFDTHYRNSASNSWNAGIQRELSPGVTMDLSYVGSKGTSIYRSVDANPPDPALVANLVAICSSNDPAVNPLGCTADQVSSTNLYLGAEFGVLPFDAVAHNALVQAPYQRSVGYSNYNALQLKVTHQLRHGIYAQLSYTWSHALDNSSDPIVPAQNNRTFPRNSRNLNQDYGNSDNDVRQIAVVNYIWQVPFGKGHSFLSNGVAGKIFEGWQFSGVTSAQTGSPFEVRCRRDSQRTGIASWCDHIGDPFAQGFNNDPANNPLGNKVYWGNPYGAFATPAFGRAGTVARNAYYGPGYVNFDLAFEKTMKVTERVNVEFRVEGYNIFNRPEFQQPDNLFGDTNFGLITATKSRPDGTTSARQMQAAVKVNF